MKKRIVTMIAVLTAALLCGACGGTESEGRRDRQERGEQTVETDS